jgi:hypothetical protein
MGYKKIILCGCPMQGSNLTAPKKAQYNCFQEGWLLFAKKMFEDKVRSMSGWTKDFLGYPTKEWLNE